MNRRAVLLPTCTMVLVLGLLSGAAWMVLSPVRGNPLAVRVIAVTTLPGIPKARTSVARHEHEQIDCEIRNTSEWPIVITGILSLHGKVKSDGAHAEVIRNLAADWHCTRKVPIAPGESYRIVLEAPGSGGPSHDWQAYDLTFGYRWFRTDQTFRDDLRRWYNELREELPVKLSNRLPFPAASSPGEMAHVVIPMEEAGTPGQ